MTSDGPNWIEALSRPHRRACWVGARAKMSGLKPGCLGAEEVAHRSPAVSPGDEGSTTWPQPAIAMWESVPTSLKAAGNLV